MRRDHQPVAIGLLPGNIGQSTLGPPVATRNPPRWVCTVSVGALRAAPRAGRDTKPVAMGLRRVCHGANDSVALHARLRAVHAPARFSATSALTRFHLVAGFSLSIAGLALLRAVRDGSASPGRSRHRRSRFSAALSS